MVSHDTIEISPFSDLSTPATAVELKKQRGTKGLQRICAVYIPDILFYVLSQWRTVGSLAHIHTITGKYT